MKIIYNGIIPLRGFTAMNLFGILLVRKDRKERVTDKLINHERIHTCQMMEMLVVFFYLWYLGEWIIRLFILRDSKKAYRSISLEREAYEHESDEKYLSKRKHYNWIRKL